MVRTIYHDHHFYKIISCACDKLRCGLGCFEILADRPLNHGHLIVCRVWCCVYRRGVWEDEYRFIIDEDDIIYSIDHAQISRRGRGVTFRASCGRAGLHVRGDVI